jgi:hypothetical protein|tara:strand:+ start:925 stop:2097 length:1173 start_codon:yes stop_codon:yes gene_type:complete
MSKKKKNFQPHKGNKVNQSEFKFVNEFNTWRQTCQGISGDAMQVKNVPNLYMFLKTHMMNNIRAGSRNKGRDGEGAIEFIEFIEAIVDNDLFDGEHEQIIREQAKTLESYYREGSDAGGKGPARDPAFILFTEVERTKTGQKKRPRTVQGHYATEWYAKRNKGVTKVPDEWLAHVIDIDGFEGGNPPHQALFSKVKTKFANPRGLLWIMKQAVEDLDDMEMEVEIGSIPPQFDDEIDGIRSVEEFFNKIVRDTNYWNAGGRLLTNKVRSELKATDFKIKPNAKEQALARKVAKLGEEGKKDSLSGTVTGIKLTALPIINLVDRALKRKNTNKAPNGFRAWQQDRKTGFDYRKTAKEAFPKTFDEPKGRGFRMKPNQKVISKMWQQLLWRE